MMMVAEFKNEVLDWANEIGVNPKEIHIREMKRKWASCSSKGRLTFSFELLEKSFEERANAIVHELLHLKYPNHGEMFNALLKTHLSKKGIKANFV
jgi:hypothetical protein